MVWPLKGEDSVLFIQTEPASRVGLIQMFGLKSMSPPTPTFTDPWYSKPGFVYFIGAGDPLKAIKIGVTIATGFKSRLRGHQSSNHEPLRVLGVIDFTMPGQNMLLAEKLEQLLHKQFAAHQRFQASWVGCEWFNPHPDILAYIQASCVNCSDLGLPDSVAKHGPGLAI